MIGRQVPGHYFLDHDGLVVGKRTLNFDDPSSSRAYIKFIFQEKTKINEKDLGCAKIGRC